jgi:flagellar motor protein MotB
VRQGGELIATASGFMPGTPAVLNLLTPPITLAVVQVTANGAFAANVLIPSSLTPGIYLSQVNGFTADGEVRSVTLGFEVVNNPEATPKQLRTKVFFEAKSSSVNKQAKKQIAKALKRLPKVAQDITVQVIGYVQPDRTPNDDDELSTARAMNVARVMARSGLKGRYFVSGQGRAPESNKQARRVEITIGFTIR